MSIDFSRTAKPADDGTQLLLGQFALCAQLFQSFGKFRHDPFSFVNTGWEKRGKRIDPSG